jgi:hypothetical protein
MNIPPPPPDIREDPFQAEIIKLACLFGWRIFHVSDSRREVRGRGVSYLVGDKLAAGWPDLTLAHRRRGLFAVRELKSNTGRVEPEQREWLETLTACGVDAGIWRPRDWAELIVPFLTNTSRARRAA